MTPGNGASWRSDRSDLTRQRRQISGAAAGASRRCAERLSSRVMGGTPRPQAIHEEADASACVGYVTDSDEMVSRKPLGSTTSNTRVFHSLSNGSD